MANKERAEPMTLILETKTKTYHCDHMDFEVNERGKLVVTLISKDFPAPMPFEESLHILNDPIFARLLSLAYQHAVPGTPIRCAFDRMERDGGTAELHFKQFDTDFGAAA